MTSRFWELPFLGEREKVSASFFFRLEPDFFCKPVNLCNCKLGGISMHLFAVGDSKIFFERSELDEMSDFTEIFDD